MMRWMVIAVCLVGCTGPKTQPLVPVPQAPKMSGLKAPIEAEDLDPDPNVLHVELVATAHTHTQDGKNIEGFAYNGQLPGPTLRIKTGDTLRVDLTNKLDMPTTIHWHGVHVPFAMDGVTWKTEPVAPNGKFTYEFTVNQAGTYWYHPHFNTGHQVDGGLYGALIVEDPADPKPDEDIVLVFDGFGEHVAKDDKAEITEGHEHEHTQALVSRWLVNGQYQPTFKFKGGTRVRVRMINVTNAAYLDVRMPQIAQVASDQGRLPQLVEPDRIVLAPSDRADVMWYIGKEGFEIKTMPYTLNGGDVISPSMAPWSTPQTLLNVAVDDPKDAPKPAEWPWSQEPPSPDPKYTDIVYTFSGSPTTGKWLMNGETFPDVTIEEVPLNAERIIEVRNLSPTEHPFHLHGHGFEVLSVNGVQPQYKTMEDTINVRIRERVRLKLIANNPGDWMAHCHILPHAGGGMMTVLRVLAE